MNLQQSDLALLYTNINNITCMAKKAQLELMEPSEKEIREITGIILSFISEMKRKIYGGFGLNMLIYEVNKQDAFYTKYDLPDIDFYSPEPIKDLIALCNVLYKKGYKKISGKEAIHKETYSLRVNNHLYCDISYVPNNIYRKMPFKIIQDLHITGAEFMMIDYLRMFNNIILDHWRLEKAFARYYLLQKYYPLPFITKPINIHEPENTEILDVIQTFLETKHSCVLVGFYAYNHYLHNSGWTYNKNYASVYKYLPNSYFEVISVNYREDAREIINIISKNPKFEKDINIVEHYPFFQYLGYSVCVYYKEDLILKIYDNNKRCVPYMSCPSYKFDKRFLVNKYNKNKIIKDDINKEPSINIGSISTFMLYTLIIAIKSRIEDNAPEKNIYYSMLSHINLMKNYYLECNNKTIYDKTPFEQFTVRCVGMLITPEQERQLLIESRKMKGKRYIFSYDPSEHDNLEEVHYIFSNSSGNPIQNNKNLQLIDDFEILDNKDGNMDNIDNKDTDNIDNKDGNTDNIDSNMDNIDDKDSNTDDKTTD